MAELQVGDQTIRWDREATIAAYESVVQGGAEECGCMFCRNFAAQRGLVYPASFLQVLERLGIDPTKEGEVFEYGPVGDGVHLYGGWFYLAGEMVNAGERNCVAPEVDGFDYFFGRSAPAPPAAFRSGPWLALEFTLRVKWVIPEPPEYSTSKKSS
jgi:hypothetical protein